MNPGAVVALFLLTLPGQSWSGCAGDTVASTSISKPDRFKINKNGTVSDSSTGLMWQRCLLGLTGVDCSEGKPSTHTWVSALNEARGDEFAGYKNWRLPKLNELKSIVCPGSNNPSIDLSVFPNQTAAAVWSASANLDYATDAWSLDFGNGESAILGRDQPALVRLVRSLP